MILVPTKKTISSSEGAATSARFSPARTTDAGIIGAKQLADRGAVTTRLGQVQSELSLEVLNKANQLRVDDAVNQAREEAIRLQYDPDEGYTNYKGEQAFNRPDGKPLADEYGGKLETHLGKIGESLSNDAQRELFAQQSANLLAGFRESTIQYEGQEFQAYSKSVRTGTIANRQQEIALNFNNPAVVQDAILDIEFAAKDLARQNGKSSEEATAIARTETSRAHLSVINTAVQNENLGYAAKYFKDNADKMDANDIIAVNTTLGGQMDEALVTNVVGSIMRDRIPDLVTDDIDKAFNILLGQESGDVQLGGPGSVAGPNEPTTSYAGAIGAAQVMPGTAKEAAKLAGLEWDEKRYKYDGKYNRAIGKAYFEQQLRTFDGSLTKAYAAYNSGPGTVSKAVKSATKAGEPEKWQEHMRKFQSAANFKQTQDYVSRNMAKFEKGKGANKAPSLEEVQEQVREKVGTDNPRVLRLALYEAKKQYDNVKNIDKTNSEKAIGDVMRALVENGGDYKSLDPVMKSVVPRERMDEMITFADKIASGNDETNLVLYNDIMEDPDKLVNLSDDQFAMLRAEFNEADFRFFGRLRDEKLKGSKASSKNPENLNTGAIKRSLDIRLLELGIKPTGSFDSKGKPKGDTQRVGSMRKFINTMILEEQAVRGEKMNDTEVDNFIDQIFANRVHYDEWIDFEGPAIVAEVKDLPKAKKKALVAAYKKRGVPKPSDEQILQAYWRQQFLTQSAQLERGSY